MRRDSGISSRAFNRFTFDRFDVDGENRPAFDVVTRWCSWLLGGEDEWFERQEKSGLFLYSPTTGCGKTHLAVAAAIRLIDAGLFTRFLRVVDVPRNDQDAVRDLSNPLATPVLVLDDLGPEKQTPRLLECAYSIVDGRLWDEEPLIVTTNHSPGELTESLNRGEDKRAGDRLVGRLLEACVRVPVLGRDRRREG